MSSYKKAGLRALGLSIVAALSLMAVMATGAQANWLVLDNGKVEEPEVTVELKNHSHFGTRLFVEKETKLEILCLTIKQDPTAPLTLLKASAVGHGHVLFETCKTWQGGIDVSKNCTPVEPILAGGLVEVVLHNSQNYLLVKPLTAGGNFTQLKFVSPCALPATNNITGDVTAECGLLVNSVFVHLDCKVHQTTQVLQEVPASALFPHNLRFGTKEALLIGLVDARIEGPALYAGASFGGHI